MSKLLSDSQVNEKACELAHGDVKKEFATKDWQTWDKDSEMYMYSPDAQEFFNGRYDHYWDEIVEGRIKI